MSGCSASRGIRYSCRLVLSTACQVLIRGLNNQKRVLGHVLLELY